MDDAHAPFPATVPLAAKPADAEALPQSGGSWTRDASGKLTQTTHPTRPAAPPGKAYRSADDASDLTLVDAPPAAPVVAPKE